MSSAMYSEHLRSKLRKANITQHNLAEQLFLRAASQANTSISLVNARLELDEHGSRRDLQSLSSPVGSQYGVFWRVNQP